MDCDLRTFTEEVLGKWGFTMSDWIYLQQAYAREKEIQDFMDIRDGITDRYSQPERLSEKTPKGEAIV